MSESPEQVLNRISAVITSMAMDAVIEARDASPRDPMDEVFDREAFELQVHRLLRDEAKELWEESTAEVDLRKVETSRYNLSTFLHRLIRLARAGKVDEKVLVDAEGLLERHGTKPNILRLQEKPCQ